MPTEFQNVPPALTPDGTMINSELSTLYQTTIEPIIKRLIGARLRVSLRPNDDSRNNQDALELLSEAKVLVLQKLRSSNGDEPIRDLEAYVRSVTANVFNQHLRKKYPRRLSLKNQFRYLFTHHAELSLRKTDNNRWVCGLTSFRDNNNIPSTISLSDEQRSDLQTRIASVQNKNSGREIIEFAFGVFELNACPAFLDDLVSVACDVLNIVEMAEMPEPENISELAASSATDSALSTLENEEFVRRLWAAVLELPLRHRVALLLNFKDEGDNLITMLPNMRVASIRNIAEALGLVPEKFAIVWKQLPWDDNRISEHLAITRQQVINLRQSARQMLRRRFNYEK